MTLITRFNLFYRSVLKQGYFFMFNQEEFHDKKMNREGSRRDEEALCKTFYNFGFDPKYKRNLKVRDIQTKAKECTFF